MSSPRFALDDQIAAIPATVRDVLAAVQAPALDPERPVLFSGIGTSLHAARVAADWVTQLTGGRTRAPALDAHHLAARVPLTGEEQVVVISHRGWKRYPTAALAKAHAAGCLTVAVVGAAAPEQPAEITLHTCGNETAGTFSVSYLASLAALARVAAGIATATAPAAGGAAATALAAFSAGLARLPADLAATVAEPAPIEAARRLDGREPLLLIGFGVDHPTVEEAALKLKEGSWLWTEGLSVEFALHGTPAVYRPGQGAVVVLPGEDDGGRTAEALGLLAKLGIETVTLGAAPAAAAPATAPGLPRADIHFAATDSLLRPFTAIVPFHRLTAELARLRGTDPDTLHGNRDPWASAMKAIQL